MLVIIPMLGSILKRTMPTATAFGRDRTILFIALVCGPPPSLAHAPERASTLFAPEPFTHTFRTLAPSVSLDARSDYASCMLHPSTLFPGAWNRAVHCVRIDPCSTRSKITVDVVCGCVY